MKPLATLATITAPLVYVFPDQFVSDQAEKTSPKRNILARLNIDGYRKLIIWNHQGSHIAFFPLGYSR